ncbi:MAG: M15 family metallopeptidase [Actinomycetota bacterium]
MRGLRVATAIALTGALVGGSPMPAGAHDVEPPPLDDPWTTTPADGPEVLAAVQRGSEIVVASEGAPAPPPLELAAPNEPPVAIAATDDGGGYWLAAGDGGVFAVGDARFFGSMGSTPLNEPVVAMAPTASGEGYWLGASDGGIFAFGDARFFGSMGGTTLNEAIVGMAPTGSGRGYWMVASDGGIFAFGDADFFGSLGSSELRAPIVAMEPTPDGDGYWLVDADGTVFAFGAAASHGSSTADRSGDPVTSIVSDAEGTGYWILTESGDVFEHGTAAPTDVGAISAPDLVVDATAIDGGLWAGVAGPRDHVVTWQSGGFSSAALRAVGDAAAASGMRAVVMDRATVPSTGVLRDGEWLQRVTPGWRVPLSAMGIDPLGAATVVGADVAAVIGSGDVVMSARSAALRNARVGDVVVLVTPTGRTANLTIGLIAPDRRIRGAELVMARSVARGLGIDRPQTAVLVGDDPATAIVELDARYPSGFFRILRAGDPPLPNGVLGSVALKELLGEIEYRPAGGTNVALDPDWVAAWIVTEDVPIIGRLRCHRDALAAFRAAMAEVEAAGLAGLINPTDSRLNGGCYVPRLIRGSSGGTLSRHSYGIAIDINPSTNRFGATPTMDPRIVEIVTSHGFSWGGTWTRPDGMHFEWTGPVES